jgi:hypothetical protein
MAGVIAGEQERRIGAPRLDDHRRGIVRTEQGAGRRCGNGPPLNFLRAASRIPVNVIAIDALS